MSRWHHKSEGIINLKMILEIKSLTQPYSVAYCIMEFLSLFHQSSTLPWRNIVESKQLSFLFFFSSSNVLHHKFYTNLRFKKNTRHIQYWCITYNFKTFKLKSSIHIWKISIKIHRNLEPGPIKDFLGLNCDTYNVKGILRIDRTHIYTLI